MVEFADRSIPVDEPDNTPQDTVIQAGHDVPGDEIVSYVLNRPELFSMIQGLIPVMGSLLCWKRSSISFASQIVHMLGELPQRELSHTDLAHAFYPESNTESAKRKIGRHLKEFRFDMAQSRCHILHIKQGNVRKDAKGNIIECEATTYSMGNLYAITAGVADALMEQGLMPIEQVKKRNGRFREILFDVLASLGCQRIDRDQIKAAKKEGDKKGGTEAYAEAFSEEPDNAARLSMDERVTLSDEAMFEAVESAVGLCDNLIAESDGYEQAEHAVMKPLKYLTAAIERIKTSLDSKRLQQRKVNSPGFRQAEKPVAPIHFADDRTPSPIPAASSRIPEAIEHIHIEPCGFPQEEVPEGWTPPF